MKLQTLFLSHLFLFVCAIGNSYAQTTGLFTYNGGYFIKNGNAWSEYRPEEREEAWATYTHYNEEADFYNIKNNRCSLSVPKRANKLFYIYKNNGWEMIYDTREIYNYFNDASRKIYCYEGGYFVRDGDTWREYRPIKEKGIWSTYTQYNEDDNYYMVENSLCKVSIPKTANNDFYIMNNNKWEKCYVSTNIYDVTSYYDFNFFYKYYKVSNSEGKMQDMQSPARISFDRKGKGAIYCNGKTYPFTFKSLCILTLKNSDKEIGFRLSFDDDNFIAFMDDWCMVNVENFCPFMNFMDNTNTSSAEAVKNLIKSKEFFN